MNYGPLIFLAAFFALATSWFGLVLSPQIQVGRLPQTNTVPDAVTYPLARPGLAKEGINIYRANGCASCHSQQLGQTATVADVILTDPGTNQTAIIAALLQVNQKLSETEAKQLLGNLPKTVLQGVKKSTADAALRLLKTGDAKAELWVVPTGPDIARSWGKRRSVAEDFLFDYPVMPGALRIGPDLAGVGLRLADPTWHLLHLYDPRSLVKDSNMPPYRFLFEKRRIERGPSPDALPVTGNLAPPPGFEIIPTAEARSLVAYLISLRGDAPLFNAPLTVPVAAPAATNAPGASAGITNAAPTNAPAK